MTSNSDLGNTGLTTLVGREVETAQLHCSLSNIQSSPLSANGRLVLIAGNSGVGKSAIAQLAMDTAQQMGFDICRVACEPFHEGMSFFPIRELVRQLLKGQSLADEIARIYGSISSQAIMASVSESMTADPASRREALVATFSNVIYGRFRSQNTMPVLLFIDDLEHLDAGSADALISLMARIREGSVILIGAYRTDLVTQTTHPIKTIIRSARRQDGLLTFIELDAFSQDAIPALTETILGSTCQLPQTFYDKLYRETEGNPLFIKEVLSTLRTTTSAGGIPPLYRDDNVWRFKGSLELWTIPESIEEVISARLNQLELHHRSELEYAAVIGRRFAFEVLSCLIASGEDELLQHLEHLVSFNIIRELEHSDDSFEFSHGKIRDVLYGSLSGLRRRRIHNRVASVLQELQGTTNEDWDALIGEHLFQAANHRDAFPFLLRAARNARKTGSTREAVGLFRKSYTASEHAVMHGTETRQSVLLEFAAALISASLTDEAGALLESLTQSGVPPGIRGWALNYLADAHLFEGDVNQAIDTYLECLRLARAHSDTELICEVLCDLTELHGRQYERIAGVDVAVSESHRRLHMQYNLDAFNLLHAAVEPSRRARVLRNRAKSLRVEGQLIEALEFYEQSLAAVDSRVAGHRFQIPYAKTLRLVGRTSEALMVTERVLAWATQVGSTRSAAIASQYKGLFLMMGASSTDELVSARIALRTAVQQHQVTGDSQSLHETEIVLGEVSVRLGDSRGALEHFRRSVRNHVEQDDQLVKVIADELDANGETDRADYLRQVSLED